MVTEGVNGSKYGVEPLIRANQWLREDNNKWFSGTMKELI